MYRFALRGYVAQMIKNRRNLCWSIEGGRTRTGKLRPPTYGLLHYVIDALDADAAAQALIVPVSIVYDQLHEVPLMTAEARGTGKRPEDLRWLSNFGRSPAGARSAGRTSSSASRSRCASGSPSCGPTTAATTRAVERIALETATGSTGPRR